MIFSGGVLGSSEPVAKPAEPTAEPTAEAAAEFIEAVEAVSDYP